jgi:hypothetical protein
MYVMYVLHVVPSLPVHLGVCVTQYGCWPAACRHVMRGADSVLYTNSVRVLQGMQ